MAVKKKVIVKRAATRKKVVAAEPQAVQSVPTGDVFSTEVIEVRPNSVLLFINAENRGTIDTTNQTVEGFVIRNAQNAGIKNFSVYADGVKLTQADGSKPVSSFAKIELVSKDSRGAEKGEFFA